MTPMILADTASSERERRAKNEKRLPIQLTIAATTATQVTDAALLDLRL